MDARFKVRLKGASVLKKPFLLVDIEGRQGGCGGDGMARIGIAVSELHRIFRALHKGVVDILTDQHGPHGDHAAGDALGAADHVRHHTEALGPKVLAKAAKARDDLVENQQDAVLRAEFA